MPAEQENPSAHSPPETDARPIAPPLSVINNAPNNGVQGINNGTVTINNAPAVPPHPVRTVMLQQVRTIW